MTIPSEEILFAESAAPGDVSDPSGVRSAGYPFKAPVPHEEFNYLFRALGRWTDNLRGGSAVYASYAEFLAEAAVGEMGIIDTFDPNTTNPPLSQISTAVGVNSVSTDGEYFFTEDGSGTFEAVSPGDVSTAVVTYSPASAVTGSKQIVSNGKFVAIAYDDIIELFDRDSGARVWDYTYSGTSIAEIDIDSAYVHLVGNNTAQAYEAINLGTASVDYAFDTDSTGLCVESNGLHTYVGVNSAGAGAGAGITSGDHLLIIETTSGSLVRADNLGTTPLVLHHDGTWLYIGTSGDTFVFNTEGFRTQSQIPLGPTALDSDARYLYIGTSAAGTWAIPKEVALWAQDPTTTTASGITVGNTATHGIAVAGDSIVYTDGSSCEELKGLDVNKPRRWRRADPVNETFLPYRKLAYPLE